MSLLKVHFGGQHCTRFHGIVYFGQQADEHGRRHRYPLPKTITKLRDRTGITSFIDKIDREVIAGEVDIAMVGRIHNETWATGQAL